MTIRTRIHGYTGWINMRLLPFEQSLSNVLMDLLRGTNMRFLIESYTGKTNEKLLCLENMTKEQLQNRIKWALKELKEYKIIPEDVYLDTRLFAMRSSKQVFDLLWRLVVSDIYFLWERIDFLSNPDDEVLIQVPFTWVPNNPTEMLNKSKNEISSLSGFSFIQKSLQDEEAKEAEITDEIRFPGTDIMKGFSLRNLIVREMPDPKICIIEMINIQLRTVPEGKKIIFTIG